MPVHKAINPIAGKQRRTSRRAPKKICLIFIVIANTFLNVFNLWITKRSYLLSGNLYYLCDSYLKYLLPERFSRGKEGQFWQERMFGRNDLTIVMWADGYSAEGSKLPLGVDLGFFGYVSISVVRNAWATYWRVSIPFLCEIIYLAVFVGKVGGWASQEIGIPFSAILV